MITGVCVAFFPWILLKAVGLHAFWSIPAGAVAIFLVPVIAGRKRSDAERRPRSALFFTLLGAIAFAPLGVWFAVSEGDIRVVRAGLTLAAMGSVLGLIVGLLAKVRRAIRNRRTACCFPRSSPRSRARTLRRSRRRSRPSGSVTFPPWSVTFEGTNLLYRAPLGTLGGETEVTSGTP